MKHEPTGGEWEVEIQNGVAKVVTEDEHIASFYADTEECIANAQIAAASKELLRVIKILVIELEDSGEGSHAAIMDAKEIIKSIQ